MSEVILRNILLPIDGSDVSFKAARYAIKLAKEDKGRILCIHVIGKPIYLTEYRSALMLPSYYEEAKKLAESWFAHLTDIASKENVSIKTEMIFDVISIVDAIVSYALNENVDLIVMGTKGKTGLKKFLLGSVANGVVLHSHCPVLVVR